MLNLYPRHILFEKVINQITHRKNKLWQFLPFSRISLSGIGDIPDKSQLKAKVLRLIGDVSEVVSSITKEEQAVILAAADKTLHHEFDYLGSGFVQMPSIRWHDDFKSGKSWKKGVFYLKQRRSTAKGADIKVPWELSRGHHMLWLGEAYQITRDERYAKEVVDEIEDWWHENPFMYSVNWTCTMDVAIRAVNWLYAIGMVLDSPAVSDAFAQNFYRSLYQHGWFIYNNLEQTIPYSNNHLFSDLAGLTYLSLFFNNTKRGKEWSAYVKSALFTEIRNQVLPSGVHYERSVSYHRLMTEMILASIYVLKRAGTNVPADIEYRASSMLSYISSYTKENHLSPIVEDNDDGRFLPFIRRDFRQHDYLLDESSAESLFLSQGVEPIEFEQVKASRIYKDAGHAILRNGDAYLFVTNGEQSSYESTKQTVGTHTHNDKLSFELAIGKDDVIIDPGAYIYTPEPAKSNEFRSTAKHNTVIVDGEEQNLITPKNVFLATKNSRATMFSLASDRCIEGEYSTFAGELRHNRIFQMEDCSVIITDTLTKKGSHHEAVLSFHLAPHLNVRVNGNMVLLETKEYFIEIVFDDNYQIEVIDDSVSSSYGVIEDAKTILAKLTFCDSVDINTRIQWKKKL